MRQRALVFVCVVVLAGCSGGEPVAMSQTLVTTIDIHDFYYSPASATVRAGTTIEWVNRGPSAHTATSDDGVWDSGSIAAPSGGGGTPPPGTPPPGTPPPNPYARSLNAVTTTFSTILSTPGVYGFHCSLHPPSTNPNFVGTITVTE
jgi:plastocyanin